MVDGKSFTWTGKSGTQYVYRVFAMTTDFKNTPGNYIFCKIVDHQWQPVYIGQGILGQRIHTPHEYATGIMVRKATHVHAHANPDEEARLKEVNDLLENHPEACKPVGCNEKQTLNPK